MQWLFGTQPPNLIPANISRYTINTFPPLRRTYALIIKFSAEFHCISSNRET